MIRETYRSERLYDESKPRKRYAKFSKGRGFSWIVVMDDHRDYDAAQGTCAASDLPVHVMDAALDLALAGTWPPYVEWAL